MKIQPRKQNMARTASVWLDFFAVVPLTSPWSAPGASSPKQSWRPLCSAWSWPVSCRCVCRGASAQTAATCWRCGTRQCCKISCAWHRRGWGTDKIKVFFLSWQASPRVINDVTLHFALQLWDTQPAVLRAPCAWFVPQEVWDHLNVPEVCQGSSP